MADKPDVSDNNQQRDWLQRILDRWRVYARGDVIAGKVGEKASNVLIGKNIIQIGSIKMPIWLALLAATGVIIGVISIILITRNVAAVTSFVMAPTLTPTITAIPTATPTPTITPTPTPAPMTGDFNVAIAAFEVIGEGDGLLWANELVQGFANSVEQIVHELSNELGDEIEIRFPDQVAAVMGQTDGERVSNARRVAQEIKADVVIYGVVEVNQLQATIKPEFYVNELRNRELTALDTGAAELVGPYRMGLPIDVEKIDNRSSRNQAEAVLRKRLDALIYIVIGLSDFAIGAYAEAEARFLQASELQAWDNPDVIYVMLGNAALQQEKLTEADAYYQQAIGANEFYTRAYIGRGSVLYGMVRQDAASQNDFALVDRDRLAQAITLYQRALDPTLEQPPFADVPTKANFGLGQAYFLLGLADLRTGDPQTAQEGWTAAEAAFRSVIADYAVAQNERIQELTAHAHARIALLYRIKQQPQIAIDEYTAALDLLPKLQRVNQERASYEAALGDIYSALAQPEAAATWFEKAVQHVTPGSEEEKRYKEKLDALQTPSDKSP